MDHVRQEICMVKKKGAPGTLQTISLFEIKDLLKERELP
jgi:hypothetical protein